MIKSFNEFELNEKMGVADGVRSVIDQIKNTVLEKTKAFIIDPSRIGSKKFSITVKNPPEQFPVHKLKLEVIREAQLVSEISYEAAYLGDIKQTDKGLEFSFMFNITLPVMPTEIMHMMGNDGAIKEDEESAILGNMYHEFTHAYEDYKRRSGGSKTSLSSQKEFFYDKASSDIRDGNRLPQELMDFLYNIYAVASYEINARVAQTEAYIEKGKTREERIALAKGTYMWDVVNRLTQFEADKFKKNLIEDGMKFFASRRVPHREAKIKVEAGVNTALSQISTALYNNYERVSNMILENPDQKHIKEITSFFNDVQKNEELKQGILDKIKFWHNDIERLSHKSPDAFLKYWERKFHFHGEKLRRKMLRVVASKE